jgi:hypothetical protein
MELLAKLFNDPLMQSMVIGPIMGLLLSLLFVGLTQSPPGQPAAQSAVGVTVNQTQKIYIQNHHHHARNSSTGENDGMALLFIFGFALCWVLWKYAVMAVQIQTWIGAGLMTAISFSVFAIICAWFKGHYTSKGWWFYTVVPLVLLCGAMIILLKASDVFDPRITERAQGMNFWAFYTNGLSGYGRSFVFAHVLGLIALCALIGLSFFALLHYLALMNQRAAGFLRPFWSFLTRATMMFSGKGWLVLAGMSLALAVVGVYPQYLSAWMPSA